MSLRPQLTDLLELRHQARTVGMASHHLVNSALCGLYASVFRGHGMDFEEVREYQEGDEIRNMDWRVTARTGVPHLKVFREERERSVFLCVEIGDRMAFGTRGTFKSVQAARVAALLGWSANNNQDRVGALLYGDPVMGVQSFRPTRARRSLWQMLRVLTEPVHLGRHRTDPFSDVLAILNRSVPTGALVFLIADLNRDPTEWERPLGQLRQRREVVLLPIDDPADRDIPPMGRVLFGTPDGRRLEVDTDSAEGRALYRARWEQARAHWVAVATRLGIAVIPIATEDNVRDALQSGLRLRAQHMVGR